MKIDRETLLKLPKTELHLHLDCSLSFDVVRELRPEITAAEYKKNFIAPAKCPDLADFLKCAASGISLMQTEIELRAVVTDLFRQLQRDNVIYAELRFAPLQHLERGLTPEEVVEITADSVRQNSEATGIKAGLLLCTLRHFSEAHSLQTVKLAERYIKDGIVAGIDIAADEAGFPIDAHREAFDYAIKKEIPRTAHAGEARGPESVWESLINFKPRRIGHGVRSIEDGKLVEHLAKKGIHLEVCPSCNVQIDVFPAYRDHPVDALYKKGVSLGINTDARALVNVTLSEEYARLHEFFGWETQHFFECNGNALAAAFVSGSEMRRLQKILIDAYAPYLTAGKD
jgi:adenosine deaminase